MQDMNRKLNIRTVKWGRRSEVNQCRSSYGSRYGIDFVDLHVLMSYGGYGDAKCDGRKDQPYCRSHVSSVKPFQLMIGKIIGIGLVGVAQLAIWAVLIVVLLAVAGGISGSSPELMGGASGLLATLRGLNLAKMGRTLYLEFYRRIPGICFHICG